MKQHTSEQGFTAVELLVTLFVTALFLFSGYQLFNVVLNNGSESRNQASANNAAYRYLRQYQSSATNPCTATTPVNAQAITVVGLANPTVTVAITCPLASATSLSRVEATVTYGVGTDAKTVKRAVLVDNS